MERMGKPWRHRHLGSRCRLLGSEPPRRVRHRDRPQRPVASHLERHVVGLDVNRRNRDLGPGCRLVRRQSPPGGRALSYRMRLRGFLLIAWLATLALVVFSIPSQSVPIHPRLAAVSGAWTQYHRDDAHTGNDPTLGSVSFVSTGWTSAAMDGEVFGSPLVFNGVVYAATLRNTVYAFNQADGTLPWSQNAA